MRGDGVARLSFMARIVLAICAAVPSVLAATSARADDIIVMISQYRREHGLGTVKVDPQLTAVAERQAKAMAAAGVLSHDVAGPFSSRISGVNTDSAGENVAAGAKSWADALRMWKESPGHNANLLRSDGDFVGIAVAYNPNTRFKSYWAMVIAHKPAPPRTRIASGVVRDGSAASAVTTGGSPEFMVAAAPTEPAAEERKPRRTKRDKSPGLFDSLGTALRRVTAPIRSLWN
jgi:hypothetical protein